MTPQNSNERRAGGQTRIPTAQIEVLREQMDRLIAKTEKLLQGLWSTSSDVKEVRAQKEAF